MNSTHARRKEVATRFLSDVSKHEMLVRLDTTSPLILFRHLTFRIPGTRVCSFEITTWPGHLAFTGDMGDFVFQRLTDMFEFFRAGGENGRINPSYWAEKLVATDRSGGHEEYSADLFRERIQERTKEWAENNDLGDDDRAALTRAVEFEVLDCADDGETAAHTAARDFRFRGDEVFVDFWETNLREYTYRFIWCCHAIVWAIAQYDAYKALATEPAELVGSR